MFERKLIIKLINLCTDQQELITFLLNELGADDNPEIAAATARVNAGLERIQESARDIEIIREWDEQRKKG